MSESVTWLLSVAELGPSGAAVVAANRGAELQDDPQLRARNSLQAVGDVMVPRNPIRTRDAQGERPALSSAPPSAPLADTRAVLMEAGFARDEIDALVAAGVVAELSAV
jgi:alpha-methylacyl-CoA racemase